MDVLITGGAGFIGSSLARFLLEAGHSVRLIDNLSTGSLENLEGFDDARISIDDLRNMEAVRNAVAGAEVVFHLAALPSVQRSVADPMASHAVNVDGTLNVLTAARDAGVRRVVYASSSSVYGDTPTLPKHEDMPVFTMSPYAASKFAGEAYCRAFACVYDLETVCLRFFNVFGPRQDPNSEYAAVIPKFISRMLAERPPVIFGDGLQSRDFSYISNVVSALMLAAQAGPDANGEAMNVGCGGRTSLLELVAMLNDLLGTEMVPSFEAPRQGDVRDSEASIEKASSLIDYKPFVDVEEGLRLTAEWFAERSAGTVGMTG